MVVTMSVNDGNVYDDNKKLVYSNSCFFISVFDYLVECKIINNENKLNDIQNMRGGYCNNSNKLIKDDEMFDGNNLLHRYIAIQIACKHKINIHMHYIVSDKSNNQIEKLSDTIFSAVCKDNKVDIHIVLYKLHYQLCVSYENNKMINCDINRLNTIDVNNTEDNKTKLYALDIHNTYLLNLNHQLLDMYEKYLAINEIEDIDHLNHKIHKKQIEYTNLYKVINDTTDADGIPNMTLLDVAASLSTEINELSRIASNIENKGNVKKILMSTIQKNYDTIEKIYKDILEINDNILALKLSTQTGGYKIHKNKYDKLCKNKK